MTGELCRTSDVSHIVDLGRKRAPPVTLALGRHHGNNYFLSFLQQLPPAGIEEGPWGPIANVLGIVSPRILRILAETCHLMACLSRGVFVTIPVSARSLASSFGGFYQQHDRLPHEKIRNKNEYASESRLVSLFCSKIFICLLLFFFYVSTNVTRGQIAEDIPHACWRDLTAGGNMFENCVLWVGRPYLSYICLLGLAFFFFWCCKPTPVVIESFTLEIYLSWTYIYI